MSTFTGVGVSPGRIIGPVQQMPRPVAEPSAGEKWSNTTVDDETARLKTAAKKVQAELQRRADSATGDAKAILEATAMMAADPMLLKSANALIVAGTSAERAVWEAGAQVADMLRGLGGYMAERTQDVLDVRSRVVAELRGLPAPGIPTADHPFVLAAEDLAPADTATLNPELVIALITSSGGPQSHTAILARALGLPAVVAARGVEDIDDGTEVFVDGAAGTVLTGPGDAERTAAAIWTEQARSLGTYSGTCTTTDGHRVPLLANVGSGADARKAAEAGAEGVGLLRTEFCFLDRETEPTVAEQSVAYRQVFDAFPAGKVVVRTLDAGADKPLPFLTDASEPNPALGVRGYRTELSTPGVLDRQLKAISEAADGATTDIWVMAPMISTAQEAQHFAESCAAAGLKVPGVMVEVPSAALTAGAILQRVDFASIGTNDLTQYVMAADRQLGPLAALNDPWQPAVLQLIRHTVAGAEAARGSESSSKELNSDNGKSVGVCGEAAADPALAVVLVGLGVTSLSMSSRALAAVAAVIGSVSLTEAQGLAQQALAAPTALEARAAVRAGLPILGTLGL
ncbi:phosphoenolpyruvate--protein phosphotransferase [Arthrobacter tumbae]|uniref:phosphoenolpyruvate--protein phosphotransferase n=1 Tax=Arthrobacter tumbae TaxID=163874 RepID=UPI00195D523D|nr:phosphoenolpyruvate--protein phosphotransferase [Arthrobacter tumbae]MBM7781532.1 phosphotransferase system enzyme I (PtsI) [Arthrobacter tumbae]